MKILVKEEGQKEERRRGEGEAVKKFEQRDDETTQLVPIEEEIRTTGREG